MARNKRDKRAEVRKPTKVVLTATRNTTLAGGTFVKKGDKVEVSADYAKRVKAEKNKSFK